MKMSDKNTARSGFRITLLNAGLALLVLGIAVLCFAVWKNNRNSTVLAGYPVIETEVQLREAVAGKPQTVIVMNAPLTGRTVEDPLGILADEYIALECMEYCYVRRSRATDSMIYDTSWDLVDDRTEKSPVLTVYGDIPLQAEDYAPYLPDIRLTDPGIVKPAYSSHTLYYDSLRHCYYPDEFGDQVNNIRYQYRGIRQGGETAFLAIAGDGQLVLTGLKGGVPPLSGYNDMKSLEYAEDESVGAMAVIAFLLAGGGLFLLVCGGIGRLYQILFGKRS